MITPIQITPHRKISFGTNSRHTATKIHPDGHEVYNSSYFLRGQSDLPSEVSRYLNARAAQAQDIEWKIWGCSDMSEFLARRIVMQKEMGKDNFRRKFNNIELIDIDPEIVARNKRGIIGITKADKIEFQQELNLNLKDYFKKTKTADDFFLEGEPDRIQGFKIKQHEISPDLLEGVKIRTGDIRRELRDLPSPKQNALRIFDFANSWYFLGKDEQVDLALNFEKKLKLGDILMIGRVERSRNVDRLLQWLGFEGAQTPWGQMKTTLVKAKQLTPQQLDFIQQKILKEGRHIIE